MEQGRNAVAESHAAVIGIVSGLVAAFASVAPTGRDAVDRVLVVVAVAFVTWAAASASWWLLTLGAVAAALTAGAPELIAAAVVAAAIGLFVGWRRRELSQLLAVSAALTMNVLARAEIDARFGVTAVIAVVVGLVLVVAGLRRRPRRVRRYAWIGLGGSLCLAVLFTAAFLAEAAAARSDLTDGKRAAEEGIDAINDGDYDAAATHFERAAELFDRAHDHLGRPWTAPAAVVPVIAQHRTAVVRLSDDGAAVAAAAAVALHDVDPETLRVEGGALDLDAVRDLGEPIAALRDSLDELGQSTVSADSRWLLPAVRNELHELTDEIDDNEERLNNAADAVALAPNMLGADGPRVYLLLFTTPAEARGLGGFLGNYAELTIDHGRIEMTDFGRANDLELLGEQAGARITGPADFLARYGPFGFDKDGHGLVGSASWRNLTISPDFPSVAQVAAEMYPQVKGKQVDGVIMIDPYVVSTLLEYTGPVRLESVGVTLNSDNATDYILLDQYLSEDFDSRIDGLEEAARQTMEALLAGAMPGPEKLAHDLGPLAAEGRLAVWARAPDEQDLLRRVGLLDEIPALDGADGWAITVTNTGGNKIDNFLRRTFSYQASTGSDGTTSATIRATFENTAPATGLPHYVIGNEVGLPDGTSALYVCFYSPLELRFTTLDGESVYLEPSLERGWNVYSGFVTIPAGESVEYELTLSGVVAAPDRLVTWVQPLVTPPDITTDVAGSDAPDVPVVTAAD